MLMVENILAVLSDSRGIAINIRLRYGSVHLSPCPRLIQKFRPKIRERDRGQQFASRCHAF